MRASVLPVVCGAALLLTACSSEEPPCEAPDGCLAVSRIAGACRCLDWKIVSDEIVPVKYVVTGVGNAVPGGNSSVSYGQVTPQAGAAQRGGSEQGTRLRVLLRDAQGKVTVLPAEVPSVETTNMFYVLRRLGTSTVAVGLRDGNGWGLAGGAGVFDVPPAVSDRVVVWVNPTLRVVGDAGGNRRAIWGWSGNCFIDTCNEPYVFLLSLGALTAGVPYNAFYYRAFLDTLEPAEKAAIGAFDRFASSPPPSASELDADPRFLRLGEASLDTLTSTTPPTSWVPCTSVARDDDFPVLASTDLGPVSTGETVVLQQSWLSTSIGCSTQTPALTLSTVTPGCRMTSTVYVDRMFGTLAFLPGSVDPACTGP